MTPRPVEVAIAEAAKTHRLQYPWDELEASKPLSLIGYGSLMNSVSAQRTLPNCVRTPVVVYGVRRVFDYLMPETVKLRYPSVSDPREATVLNIRVTGSPCDQVTAMLTVVPEIAIDALRSREPDYDLVAVAYSPYQQSEIQPQIAYTLVCPPSSTRIDTTLLPHSGYLELCLRGARETGPHFENQFRLSTYLGDGTTTLDEWLTRKNNTQG
jgi:hypothetical protein